MSRPTHEESSNMRPEASNSANFDTFSGDVNPKVFTILENRIIWYDLILRRLSRFDPGMCCLVQRLVPLQDGTLFINGAMGSEEENMKHCCFSFQESKLVFRKGHDMGLLSVGMVVIGNSLYILGHKKTELYSLTDWSSSYIESPQNVHVNAGCCTFNNGILLVGGIHCKEIEYYNPDAGYWSLVGALPAPLFDIGCIQIDAHSVLIFGGGAKQAHIFNVETGEFRPGGEIELSETQVVKSVPIKWKDCVYCFVGNGESSHLVRYSIPHNIWEVIYRLSANGCCNIL
jgi:hypothetical protein